METTSDNAELSFCGPGTKALEGLSATLLAFLCLLILASTVLRHVGIGEPRLFEITRVVFVYLIGISAITAFVRAHNIFVPGLWNAASISHQLAMLLLAAVLAYLSIKYVYSSGWEVDSTSLLKLPEATPYVPILLFAIAITVMSAMRLRKVMSRKRRVVQ